MVGARTRLDAYGMNAILARTGREAAYLTAGLLTSIVAFTVVVTAVTLSVSLALFIVGLPIMIAGAVVFRRVADLDRRNVSFFLGRRVRGATRTTAPRRCSDGWPRRSGTRRRGATSAG
jgi:uncharacterized membrane protein YraQ (UPF0718 family)